MKKSIITLLMLFSWSAVIVFAAFPVSVEGNARPGGTLFIRVESGGNIARGTATFLNMTLPLLVQDGNGQVIMPVPLDTPPGKYILKIEVEKTAGNTIYRRTIPVRSHKFGIQRLYLPPSEEDKYEAPGVEQERMAIDRALKTVSNKYTWWSTFLWPVDGRISTEFGIKRYINGEDAGRHCGIDLAAPAGTPVRATNCGTVILARSDFTLHGKTVIIDHGLGITSLYIHLSRILVRPGDFVKRGQIIGRVGSTGVATGPHLHWAVYIGREAVDPRMFMYLPKSWK
ncbi:MAG: M23 family metallopeptidase [Candidatus Eremiobacteraeota bacterium]|nr:M23 family metallopeptidase [Candidatus Eremiobacteraeota bacterium]